MAHTPGPWTTRECTHGGLLVQRGQIEAGRFTHPQHSLQIVPVEDALLIAAAPELLAALKLIVRTHAISCEGEDCGIGGIDLAVAAIAKAEGA